MLVEVKQISATAVIDDNNLTVAWGESIPIIRDKFDNIQTSWDITDVI